METKQYSFRPGIRLMLTGAAIFIAMSTYETLQQFL